MKVLSAAQLIVKFKSPCSPPPQLRRSKKKKKGQKNPLTSLESVFVCMLCTFSLLDQAILVIIELLIFFP